MKLDFLAHIFISKILSIIQAFLEKINTFNENKGMCYILTPPLVIFCAKTFPYSLWAPNLRLSRIYPQTLITFAIFHQGIILPPHQYIFREMHNFTPRRIFLVKCIILPPDRYNFRQGNILPPDAFFGQMHYFTPRPI